MKTAAQKHLDAIISGKVTKTNVIGIRKILNHVERLKRHYSANRSNATPADAIALVEALKTYEPVVSGELHESGLALLQSPRYAKRFDASRMAVFNCRHVLFSLVRFDCFDNLHYVPVYKITSHNGSFLFRNIPWQSGGNGPEIVGEES